MKIDKLTAGMTLYDVHSHRMGNTTMRSLGVWRVHVISVNPEDQTILASWNGNPAKKFHHVTWSKWKLKEPFLVKTLMGGKRRPTKQELQAHKASLSAILPTP